MDVEVRGVAEDEFDAWTKAVRVGFLRHPVKGEGAARRPGVELDRCRGAFDGDRVVGTLRSFATELTVPGGAFLPAAAVTNVAVTATHRRRGLLNAMMVPDLIESKERGEAVSILIAAEWPIYGRYGYGPATEHFLVELDARTARFAQAGTGTVSLVDATEARAVMPGLNEHHRANQPGAIAWSDRWYDLDLGLIEIPGNDPQNLVIATVTDDAGRPTGLVTYKVKDTWDGRRPDVTVEVEHLLATDAATAARIWRYLCEIDWVTRVLAGDRGPEEPLPFFLADGRACVQKHRADFLWLRVLDVPAALSARRYLCSGQVTIEVTDPMGLAEGVFTLDGGPEGATCTATATSPDLTMTAGALGAAYLGGHALGVLAAAGLIQEHRAGALRLAGAMFRSDVAPWCQTWF